MTILVMILATIFSIAVVTKDHNNKVVSTLPSEQILTLENSRVPTVGNLPTALVIPSNP